MNKKKNMKHGTLSMYTGRGCRCVKCRLNFSAYYRKLRKKRRGKPLPKWIRHGTTNAYDNYSCRCTLCREFTRESMRTYLRITCPAGCGFDSVYVQRNTGRRFCGECNLHWTGAGRKAES